MIGSADKILPAHRQPAKIFLERAKCRELLREEQAVARLVDMQMRIAYAFDRLAQQHRLRVERTILDEVARDRIDRIVYEDDEVSPSFRRL